MHTTPITWKKLTDSLKRSQLKRVIRIICRLTIVGYMVFSLVLLRSSIHVKKAIPSIKRPLIIHLSVIICIISLGNVAKDICIAPKLEAAFLSSKLAITVVVIDMNARMIIRIIAKFLLIFPPHI